MKIFPFVIFVILSVGIDQSKSGNINRFDNLPYRECLNIVLTNYLEVYIDSELSGQGATLAERLVKLDLLVHSRTRGGKLPIYISPRAALVKYTDWRKEDRSVTGPSLRYVTLVDALQMACQIRGLKCDFTEKGILIDINDSIINKSSGTNASIVSNNTSCSVKGVQGDSKIEVTNDLVGFKNSSVGK